jgi:circadian clock protein KaiB
MSNTSTKKSPDNGNGRLKDELLDATEKFEEAITAGTVERARYTLRLYVSGSTPSSLKAIYNLKRLCEEHLQDYDLEVIDIYENPTAAREAQIIAAPTLIKKLPAPLRRFVGDLSNKQKLLIGLDIHK